jgi:hypothetical protein
VYNYIYKIYDAHFPEKKKARIEEMYKYYNYSLTSGYNTDDENCDDFALDNDFDYRHIPVNHDQYRWEIEKTIYHDIRNINLL